MSQALYSIIEDRIIVQTNGRWLTPGEYSIVGCAVVEAPTKEGKRINKVLDIGPETIREEGGSVYLSPTVAYEGIT